MTALPMNTCARSLPHRGGQGATREGGVIPPTVDAVLVISRRSPVFGRITGTPTPVAREVTSVVVRRALMHFAASKYIIRGGITSMRAMLLVVVWVLFFAGWGCGGSCRNRVSPVAQRSEAVGGGLMGRWGLGGGTPRAGSVILTDAVPKGKVKENVRVNVATYGANRPNNRLARRGFSGLNDLRKKGAMRALYENASTVYWDVDIPGLRVYCSLVTVRKGSAVFVSKILQDDVHVLCDACHR